MTRRHRIADRQHHRHHRGRRMTSRSAPDATAASLTVPVVGVACSRRAQSPVAPCERAHSISTRLPISHCAAAILAAAAVLASCTHTVTHAKPPTTTSTGTPSQRPVAPSLMPVVRQMRSGIYPACADTIGLPTEVIVHGHNATTGAPEVRCLTGAGDDDSTDVVMTRCQRGDFAGARLFFWATRDSHAADQSVYTGHAGGVVAKVRGLPAKVLWHHPPLSLIDSAARC